MENKIKSSPQSNETIIQNPQDIAKEFNKLFTSAGSNLAKKILITERNFQDFLTFHNEKIQFEELNINEFEEEFKSVKLNKATGFYDLSSKIIIDAYDSLKNILFHVFKVSNGQGIFPR